MYLWREFSRFVLLKKKISWQQPVAVCSFVLTSLMNPFGFKIYPYIVETAVLSRERNILEWESLSFSGLYATQTIFISILVAVFLISAGFLFRTSKEKFKKAVTSPFLPLLMLGLQNNRNTSLPFFVAIPFMCEFIFEKGEEKSEDKRKSPLNYVFLAGVFACLILFFPTLKPYTQGLLPGNKAEVYDKFTVPSIADYLNHTVDNDVVFNDWGYGSFLILAQKHPIFIDTRNIIFSNKDMHECASVFRAVSGWETILEKYKARYIILNTTMHAPLTESLEKSSKWELVMKEKSSLLFRKKD